MAQYTQQGALIAEDEETIKKYKILANKGNINGQLSLEAIYYNGYGVKQDLETK